MVSLRDSYAVRGTAQSECKNRIGYDVLPGSLNPAHFSWMIAVNDFASNIKRQTASVQTLYVPYCLFRFSKRAGMSIRYALAMGNIIVAEVTCKVPQSSHTR